MKDYVKKQAVFCEYLPKKQASICPKDEPLVGSLRL